MWTSGRGESFVSAMPSQARKLKSLSTLSNQVLPRWVATLPGMGGNFHRNTQPIDLGMWTLDFPPSTVSPALEQLAVDSSSAPVLVGISVKDQAQEITLHHNTPYRKDDGL